MASVLFIVLPSAIWLAGLLLWLFVGRRAKESPKASAGSIGVAIVGRNEEATIESCLVSVLAQQEASLASVLFADDQSQDLTLSIAQTIAQADMRLQIRSAFQTSTIESPKKNALAGAFRDMDTESIAVTDADCIVPPLWLAMLSHSMTPKCGAVLGASWPLQKTGFKERAYRWERLIANISMASACGWGYPASACGHSILYQRAALMAVDAPVRRDLPSGDDDLTVQAIARAGYRVKFCRDPRSVVREAGARGSRTAQVGRHQSVTHLYPLRWRILYAWSAVTGMATLPIILATPFNVLPAPLIFGAIAKVFVDAACGAVLARKLKLGISIPDIFLGSLLLPVWMIWRLFAFVFFRRITWRGRDFADSLRSTAVTGER